jgi:phosphoribosylanthranilate isomerase
VRGGTGERFDWGVAKSLRGRDNIVVSGGLGPENVREAIGHVGPAGVDSETRTSTAADRRRKDAERVRQFIERARARG